MVEVDGSYIEGGGQILRTACVLSAATKKPCRVFNIRKNREKLGLSQQYLLEIQTISQLCGGKLEGDYLGSEDINFYPSDFYNEKLSVKIPTAESITLILQSLIPVALLAPSPIKISFKGGATDTFFSLGVDYFRYIFLKILEKISGVKIDINILKRGYYPDGGAELDVVISPTNLKNINLTERGKLKNILAVSGSSELLKDKKTAERQLSGAREILGRLNLPLEEKIEYYQTQCLGSQICLAAEFENTIIGIGNLGKMGDRAEDTGKEAALELLKEQKGQSCLDKYMADQILPYMALAKGKSEITVSEITSHCKNNMWVIEKFAEGKFEINGNLIKWTPAK